MESEKKFSITPVTKDYFILKMVNCNITFCSSKWRIKTSCTDWRKEAKMAIKLLKLCQKK